MRKGKSQVEIADVHNVSRQAVNKAIKAQNHKVMVRLLELARSIGTLVEWQDEARGLLVGIIPQLEDRICLFLIDTNDLIKVFYSNISTVQKEGYPELIQAIRTNLDIKIRNGIALQEIIATLFNK